MSGPDFFIDAPSARASRQSCENLLAPHTLAGFIGEYWERHWLLNARSDSAYYARLFRTSDVDRCLDLARASYDEVLSIVPPHGCGRQEQRLRGVDLSMPRVYDAFHAGDTLKIHSAQRFWPPLAELAKHLGNIFGASVGINVYFTPAGSHGFGLHFDPHDFFILQIDGSKNWSIYEPAYELPMQPGDGPAKLRVQRRATPPPEPMLADFRLCAGDLLYVPRGFLHKAIALDTHSLHLTVSVIPPYWVDLLHTAIETVAYRRIGLRKGLPSGFAVGSTAREEMRDTFRALLRIALDDADDLFDEALDGLIATRVATAEAPADGHFESLTRLPLLAIDSFVEHRDLTCLVVGEDSVSRLLFGNAELRAPRAALRALEFIRDTPRFRVGDLPGMTAEAKVLTCGRLVRQGLLRVCGS